MDATVAGLVPDAHAGAHLLALPRSRGAARTPVDALARAWFADAAWTSPPGGGGAARPMAGARFRGVVPDGVVAPGELRLADGARAVGPFPRTPAQTQALDLAAGTAEAFALHVDDPAPRQVPAVADDRDGLARAFAAGLPQGLDLAAGAAEACALHVDYPAPRQGPAVADDCDGLARGFAAGRPQGLDLQVLDWAVAAARGVGGAVVADGRTVLTPDAASGFD